MTEELKQVSGETVADTGAMDSPVAPAVESSAIEGAAGSDSLVGQAARVITPPPAGQTEIVQLQPGEEFRLAANPASVQLVIDGDNLVMGFDLDGDGEPDSFVVLEDLVLMAGGGNPPALVVAGETIGTDLLVANAIALARVDDAGTAPLETAAGDTATGGGATEYSDNLGIPINLLEALDVIPGTELQFGLIDTENEIFLLEPDNSPPLADPVLSPATQGDVPAELQAALIAAGVTSPVVIDFDGLAHGTDVNTQFSGVTFSIEAGGDLETFSVAPGFTTSSPNVIVDASFQGKDVTVEFDSPVNNLTFTLMEDDQLVVGSVDVYENGVFAGTVLLTGDGDASTPELVDLSGFTNVTKIVINDTDDGDAIGFDDFSYTTSDSSEVVFFKQLDVDGSIGDPDGGDVADFGGADAETSLEDLVFTLQSNPTYGQLILVTSGGATSLLTPGDTFTSADTVWWVATEDDVSDFLSQPGAPEFLPDVDFLYSVTDEAGASATAPVVITLPAPTPPDPTLSILEGECLNEDTEGQLLFTASPTDGASKISEIVISGFPTGDPADAWVVEPGSVDVFGFTLGVDYTASYNDATGELTITFTTASFSLGETVQGSVDVTPNPDSDVDQTLSIEATAINGAGEALASDDSLIPVDADADGAEGTSGDDGDGVHLSVLATVMDESGEVPENGTFQASEIGTLNIQATFDDFLDGSETHQIYVNAPAGFNILTIDEAGLPEGVTLISSGASFAIFDVETLDGVGEVDFDLQIQNAGGAEGEFTFHVYASAIETNTPSLIEGDIECDGGEGDNFAQVHDDAVATVAIVAPPELDLVLYGDDDCVEEDSTTADLNNTVTLNVAPQGDDLLTEIVLEGFQADWTYDLTGFDTDGGGGGVVVTDNINGDGTVTITFSPGTNANYSGTFAVQPPEDSDVDHPTITATATVTDPVDPGLTGSGNTTIDIGVDADADGGPDGSVVQGVDDGDGDGLSVSVTVSDDSGDGDSVFEAGETGSVTVNATFDDFTDGSETHTVTVFMPTGFSYDSSSVTGIPTGTTVDDSDPTKIVFTVPTDSTNGTGTFSATFDVTNDSASEGTATFDAEARAVETALNGEECDVGDNTAIAEDDADATVAGIVPPVVTLDIPGDDDCIEEDSTTSDADNVVTLTVDPDGDDLLTEIVLEGFQTDWTYDLTGLDTDGGGGGVVVTDNIAGDGTVTITFSPGTNSTYVGTFAVEPPADSDIDHPTITATATVEDPLDSGLTATGDNTLDIAVDANADGGDEATGGTDDNDSDDLALTVSVEDSADSDSTFVTGESGVLHIMASFDDFQDGSETHTVTVTAPAGFTIDSVSGSLPTGVTVSSSSDGEWVFDVATDGTASGTVHIDLVVTNDSNTSGDHNFAVEVKAEETNTQDTLPSDVECDEDPGDNVSTITKEATATALDDTPSFDPGTILVHDESDGLQSAIDDDANGPDEDDIDPTIGTLPAGLQSVLGDLSIAQGDIVGVAQDTITFSYGQNGPAASDPVALSLTTQGEQSTLFASNDSEGDGSKRPIYLYQTAAGVVVGVLAVWDGDSWEDPDTLNDDAVTPSGDYVEVDESLATIAFIIYLDVPVDLGGVNNDASADTYFVQNVAIWNDDPADDDESDGSIAFEDQSVSVVVTDADDDSVTGNFTVRVEDDGPVQADGAEGNTVYESELDNAQSVGTDAGNADDDKNSDTNGDDTVITGDLSVLVDFGTDGPGGFSLNPDTSGLPDTLTSQGAPIVYDVDGNTLWGYVELGGDGGAYDPGTDRAVFSLELQASGLWTFTLIDQLDHIQPTFDTEISLDLSSAVVATDSDGDSIVLDGGFAVVVSDDIPKNISPDVAVIGSNGSFPVSVTEDLDFFDNVGADEPGDVVFDPSLQDDVLLADDGITAVTSNGEAIILDISDMGHLLTGYVESGANAGFQMGEDTTVFTVELNPDAVDEGADEYTVTLFDRIDTGGQILFDNFGSVSAGGPKEFIALDDPRTGGDDLGEDILFTASPEAGLVNASTQGAGVANQQIDAGETIRVDFVSDVAGLTDLNPGIKDDLANLTYSGHYTVNNSGFQISQDFGATNVTVRALDADDDKDFGGDPDDIMRTITLVTVVDDMGVVLLDNVSTDTAAGGVSVTFNGDGTVDITGLFEDYQVLVSTTEGFDALEITAVDSKFDLGGITTSSVDAGEPIDLDFDVVASDDDGDTSSGTIEVTVLPQIVGTAGADNLMANVNGNDLLGDGGNDTLVGGAANDKLQGGTGIDTISDGAGNDIIIGGDGADVINLAADNETDILVYDALSEAGDSVSGFDVDAPGNGDVVDLVDVLDTGDFTGTTFGEAVADGYVSLVDNGGSAEIWVDVDGTAGGGAAVLMATLNSVSVADLTDNIVVD